MILKRSEKIYIELQVFSKKCNQNIDLVSILDTNPQDCITFAPMNNLNYEYLNI